MYKRVLTTEIKREIIHSYLQGLGDRAISIAVGQKEPTVRNFIAKNGLTHLRQIKDKTKLYFLIQALLNNIKYEVADMLYRIATQEQGAGG